MHSSSHARGVVKTKVSNRRMSRNVVKCVLASEKVDISGARVKRIIGGSEVPNLDPFVRLDEFRMRRPAGFPDHPHRGFESVTYMLSGTIRHEDSSIRSSHLVKPGDLQVMRCGRGIMHCEIPEPEEDCLGLNIWLNLLSPDKMADPWTVVRSSRDIPRTTEDGVTMKVIAGTGYNGVKCPEYTRTPCLLLHFTLEPGSSVTQPVPQGWTALIYVLSGTAELGDTEGNTRHLLVLGTGDRVEVTNKRPIACQFILVAGQPVYEPVALTDFYVMNTFSEVMAAEEDFHKQKNGFEGARKWSSFIVSKGDVRL